MPTKRPVDVEQRRRRSLAALQGVRNRALLLEAAHGGEIEAADPRLRDSARNLVHYLGVRQRDMGELQQDLHALGLSSLGVLESHVLASLNLVIANLEQLIGLPASNLGDPPVDYRRGTIMLRAHARRLFGASRKQRAVRIMVTMPSEAATNERLLVDLLRAGMDVMRINCAHDDAAAWRRMAANLRRAEAVVGRRCRIQADLAGPKLRTGEIQPLGHFVHIRRRRDATGRRSRPAPVLLAPDEPEANLPEGVVSIPLTAGLLDIARAGDVLRLTDLRGKARSLHLMAQQPCGWTAEARRNAYVAAGSACVLEREGMALARGRVGDLPPVVVPILLERGDVLSLTRDPAPGVAAIPDGPGGSVIPARIHCTLPAAFERTRIGDRVWIDDGRIGGIVRNNDGACIDVEITHAAAEGAKLRAGKGINLPDSDLALSALTDKDRRDLRAVAGFVDMVALSFLRSSQDVETLLEELSQLDARHLGIMLKIENAAAFRDLPRILLASLRAPPVGVMVARGDLAVEVGFDRLSEVQEEILWLCEAAHVPVTWATQVLEGFAKAGAPSRAEVSDAVMSSRAECVMLNKGPQIVGTVSFLSDILQRMQGHHDKRLALLRRLSIADL